VKTAKLATIVVAACWSGTVTAPAPPPPVRAVSCVVRDRDIIPPRGFPVAAHGISFAYMNRGLERLDVTFEGDRARARVEALGFVIEGDVDRNDVDLRPKEDELHADWLSILSATPKRPTARGTLEVEVPLPQHFEPRAITVELPCATLTFAEPARGTSATFEVVELLEGTIALRPSPEREVIATVRSRPDHGATIPGTVVDRRPGWVRVRLEVASSRIGHWPNQVVAWVPATSVRELGKETVHPGGGGRGVGGSDGVMRCTRDTQLFLATPDGEIVVGKVKANVDVWPRHGEPKDGHIEVELGTDIAPHVKDLAACTIVTPPS
jgi:hypothetical protein